MAGDTYVTVCGNATGDVELRFTNSGTAVGRFTVASTPRSYDKQQGKFVDGDALFQRCVAFGQFAENLAESLGKGMRLVVYGRLQQRNWTTDDGQKRSMVELLVDEAGPSLKFATAKVLRAERTKGAPAHDPWAMDTGGTDESAPPPF